MKDANGRVREKLLEEYKVHGLPARPGELELELPPHPSVISQGLPQEYLNSQARSLQAVLKVLDVDQAGTG